MVERIANLYAEKTLNDKLFAEGMITEDMHRKASESITLDIDNITRSLYACPVMLDNRSMPDGIVKRKAASG